MRRYLLLILAILSLTISLMGCSYHEQAPRHQEESTSEFDEQAVFQKIENLHVENYLRQPDINDKILTYQYLEPLLKQDPMYSFNSDYKYYACIPEWRNQVKFLRQQYQQLQEIKYEVNSEALAVLRKYILLEANRLIEAIETQEVYLSDAEREEELSPGTFPARKVDIRVKKFRISEMYEQLEFLMRQDQQLEGLRDFIIR